MSGPYTPHPWNQDFAWRPATSTPTALTPDQTEAFNQQGFFVMEDLLDADTTDGVRKAYILQYAPAGAELLTGDPAAGPTTGRVPCDDPSRQYPVTRSGRSVTPDPI